MSDTNFLTSGPRRMGALGFTLATLLTAAACSNSASSTATTAAPAPVSPDVWAVVDSQPITQNDVEKAYRRQRDAGQQESDEEAMVGKLSVLNDLIVQEILLAKARSLNITVPQADVDAAFAEGKKNIPDDAFQKELTARNITAADMQESMRRQMLTEKVVAQEVSAKISVTDQDVTDFFNANRAQFNLSEESYRIAQIVVSPVREPQLANQSGDDATTPQAAAAKVQMLMERLKGGASFADLAVGYSEDAESAPRGGDLGLIPVSQLMKTPPALRNAVLKKEPGSVNVAQIDGGYALVLVAAHEMPGQRDLATPGVKEQITNGLKGRKEQLLRAAYLTAVRTDAKVMNYLARRLVEQNGKVPTLGLATPAAAPAAAPAK